MNTFSPVIYHYLIIIIIIIVVIIVVVIFLPMPDTLFKYFIRKNFNI